MRVDRTVVGDVERAVGLLEEAYSVQGRNLALAEVWNRTKDATRLADRAFFNPNMVGLLYFVRSTFPRALMGKLMYDGQPDEHKYAVYAPLFAPVSVPVVVALVKELKRWRRRRKARAAETRAVEAT
jgi:phosphatidylinositol glycan class S